MSSKLSSALVEGREEGCAATEVVVTPSKTRFAVVPPVSSVSTDRKALQQENARLLAENAHLKSALGEENVKYPSPRRRRGKAPTCAALRRWNDALREENASLAEEILADERHAQVVASIDEILSDLKMMRARYDQRERVVRFGTLCRKLSAVARGAVGRVFDKGPYLPAMNAFAASGRLALLAPGSQPPVAPGIVFSPEELSRWDEFTSSHPTMADSDIIAAMRKLIGDWRYARFDGAFAKLPADKLATELSTMFIGASIAIPADVVSQFASDATKVLALESELEFEFRSDWDSESESEW
jgi:hypothetical protein